MTNSHNSPADILDFRLLDEAGHPALNIEEKGRSNVLRLEIENVSANRLTFPRPEQNRAIKTEHHFALSFRPGALSNQSIDRLTQTDPPMDVLDRATGWDLRVERARRPSDPVTLYFLYTARGDLPQLAAAGSGEDSILRLELRNLAAAPGPGVRPSAAQLSISRIYKGGRLDPWFRFQRRAELYITHAGGAPAGGHPCGPPLKLDLLGDVAIEAVAGGHSTTVSLMLSNTSSDTSIEGDHVEIVLDIGDEDRWWALAASGEYTPDWAQLLTAIPVGTHDRLEGPMEPIGAQDRPNALRWKVYLPNGTLGPGRGIQLTMDLRTTRAKPLAIHVESDLAHFGANRQTFLFPRSPLTLKRFKSDVGGMKLQLNTINTKVAPLSNALAKAETGLANHAGRIAALEELVRGLVDGQSASLTSKLAPNMGFPAIAGSNDPLTPLESRLHRVLPNKVRQFRLTFSGITAPISTVSSQRIPHGFFFPSLANLPISELTGTWYVFVISEKLNLRYLLEFDTNIGALFIRGLTTDSPWDSNLPPHPREIGAKEEYLKQREEFLKYHVSTSMPAMESIDLSQLLGPY